MFEQQQYSDLPPGARVVSVPPPATSPTYSDLPPGAQVVPVVSVDPYAKYGGSITNDPYAKYGGSISNTADITSPQLTDPSGNLYQSTSPADASAKLKAGYKVGPPAQQHYDANYTPPKHSFTDYLLGRVDPNEGHAADGAPTSTAIDPFLSKSGSNISSAAKSAGKVLRIGGGTILKMAANPTPGGVAQALSDEALQQQADGGIPNSPEIIQQPLRELAGERQPGESLTLGFTGHDPSQQPLPTRIADMMSSVMGGNPASARDRFSQAATDDAQGNRDAARIANQEGTADLLSVPLATAGTGRLIGSEPLGRLAQTGADATADAVNNATRLTRLRTFPASSLTPDELLTKAITKGDNAQTLLATHDAVQSALPRIANAAQNSGLTISNADDMLAAIRQAKSDLLTEHQNVLGQGETLADIGPNQRAALNSDIDALNNVQKRVETLQATEDSNAAKAAAKGKPVTKGDALNQIARGAGKYAITKAVGGVMPLGGPLSRAAINAAGITSAFSDLSGGLKGLVGKGAAPSALDTALTSVFSHPDIAQLFDQPTGASLAPEPSTVPEIIQRFTGDLSVPHTSAITPPEIENGDATLIPQQTGRVPLWQQAGVEASKPSAEIPEPIAQFVSPRMRQINLAKSLANASPSAADMSGLADSLDASTPSPIGRRTTPVAQRGGVTQASTSTPSGDITPPDNFAFSRSANSGEDAAREFLTSQSLGKLKNLATARNIPFDGRESGQTLAPKLINALTDSLSEDELNTFDSARSDAQPNLFPRSRKVTGRAPANSTAPAEQDLTDVLQRSIDAVEARKAAGVPASIAEAMGTGSNESVPQLIQEITTSGHPPTGGAASLEELSRGVQHWIVDTRTGKLTYLGVSPDAGASGLRPGSAIVSVARDGQMNVVNNNSGLSDAQVITKSAPTFRREFPERFSKRPQVSPVPND